MWALGIIALLLIFFSSDSNEKVKMIFVRIPLLLILVGAFVMNPILGIIVFALIGYFGNNAK